MKKLCLFLFFGLVSHFSFGQLNGRCDIYGQIYKTDDPRRAHYKVYVGDSETFADMVVFEEENGLMADREGIWFFTDNHGFADFIIYVTEYEAEADFTIFYTDIPDYAGCNN